MDRLIFTTSWPFLVWKGLHSTSASPINWGLYKLLPTVVVVCLTFSHSTFIWLWRKTWKHCKRKKQQTWGKLWSMYGGNLKRNLYVSREGLPPVRCQILRKLFSTVHYVFTLLHRASAERVYHRWSDFRFWENFSDQSLRRNSITSLNQRPQYLSWETKFTLNSFLFLCPSHYPKASRIVC